MTQYLTMLTNDPLSILGLSGIGLLVWAAFKHAFDNKQQSLSLIKSQAHLFTSYPRNKDA